VDDGGKDHRHDREPAGASETPPCRRILAGGRERRIHRRHDLIPAAEVGDADEADEAQAHEDGDRVDQVGRGAAPQAAERGV
jgi:hypothetical protein